LNPSSSTDDFRQFLKHSRLEPGFLRISKLDIIPGWFVHFPDFHEYDIATYLQQAGLYDLFSTESKQGYYPSLVHYFFTNLSFEKGDNDEYITSLVKNIEIELTTRTIGKALHIPYHGLSLDDIHMDNEEILSKIFLPGQGLPMTNNLGLLEESWHITFVPKWVA